MKIWLRCKSCRGRAFYFYKRPVRGEKVMASSAYYDKGFRIVPVAHEQAICQTCSCGITPDNLNDIYLEETED